MTNTFSDMIFDDNFCLDAFIASLYRRVSHIYMDII